jgi:hypothetical protein
VVTSWFTVTWPLETNEEQLAKTNHISPAVHTAHISVVRQSSGVKGQTSYAPGIALRRERVVWQGV